MRGERCLLYNWKNRAKGDGSELVRVGEGSVGVRQMVADEELELEAKKLTAPATKPESRSQQLC